MPLASVHRSSVSARNLKTLEADRSTVEQVIDVIPQNVVAVAESVSLRPTTSEYAAGTPF